MLDFKEQLQLSSAKNSSMLCVGLDPDLARLGPDKVIDFNLALIEATADLVCAYKPNLAIYDALRANGLEALKPTVKAIRRLAPGVPIIGDAKRSDIANCGREYARTMFEIYGFDAVTVNPYMGFDAIEPFLKYGDRGLFVLCRTSNPGGRDLQDVLVIPKSESTPIPCYEYVATLSRAWNTYGNIGLVVGATYPQHISRVRELCPDMILLIPGVGAQGGEIASCVRSAADESGSGFIINVSRQIMYAARSTAGELRVDEQTQNHMRVTAMRIKSDIALYGGDPVPVN